MRETAPTNDARREIAMPLIAPLRKSTSVAEIEALCPPDEDILVCDPHYGGRWNAGSNGRGGGTHIPPRIYADLLRSKVAELTSTI